MFLPYARCPSIDVSALLLSLHHKFTSSHPNDWACVLSQLLPPDVHLQVEQVPLASSKTPPPIPTWHHRPRTHIRREGKPACRTRIRRCRLGRLPRHPAVNNRLCIQNIWGYGSMEESAINHCRLVNDPSIR